MMDPRVVAELVSGCVMLGGLIWLSVVGLAGVAGAAILWDSIRHGLLGASAADLIPSGALRQASVVRHER